MNIPHTINIERLKEISKIWNRFIAHKSQIVISLIIGVFFLALPVILVFVIKAEKSPLAIFIICGLFGALLFVNGLICIAETKKLKIKLDSYNKSEIVTIENIVEHLNKIKPNSSKNCFQFINTEGSGKGRRYYSWVVSWDDKCLYILRKPREIHFCHINSFTIEQKGPLHFSNAINADFHIDDKTISGSIYPEDYKKYIELKNCSPAAVSTSAPLSAPSSPPAPDYEQDDEIYKVDI